MNSRNLTPFIDREPPAGAPVIVVSGLERWHRGRWGRRIATLSGVSLTVEPGEVFGLLGPNGAGKTTTLKILLGMLRPSRGTAHIYGRSAADTATRGRVGYLTEQPYYYDFLTAAEFMDLCGVLCGLDGPTRRRRTGELLERTGLTADAGVRLRRYSKGMLQRLGLAQALIHDPPLLILDEPMSGLDPQGRSLVRDLMLSLKQQGKTILFSSHILPDVETLCDSVAILARGRVVASGRVTDLVAVSDPGFEITAGRIPPALLAEIGSLVETARPVGERFILRVADRAGMNRVVGALVGAGAELVGVTPLRSPLEAHFLTVVDGAQGRSEEAVASSEYTGTHS